ncbi:MAG TPA: filamentous hemagglutinin N-terminal domain-containing protein [Leptolyngbyaceae cyanobacterium]
MAKFKFSKSSVIPQFALFAQNLPAQLKLATLVFFSATIATFDSTAYPQIIPDNSLGAEGSFVTPSRGRELIEGGAIRDNSLFHSFREFNVNNGQQVYFVNPSGIDNIFSRVTGSNLSRIFGTLGVNGRASLFLINPNGIIFGANARLDIKGLFTATTADSVVFNNYQFSASNPLAPPILKINITPGLQYGEIHPAGEINNQGILAVGQDLNLIGGKLNLEGQLYAGNNIVLLATDNVTIRDTFTQPFIAKAGGNLLVQGNQTVDIFALNHPDSGLFSGGSMVLRSANTILGDARYQAGNNFRIERLDGSLGSLSSPKDPVIRANGDVFFDSYQGASLHILAGGKVEIPGTIRVEGADTIANSINPTSSPTEANIILSDGSAIAINGNAEPTVDIRAGTTAFATPFTETGNPTSADINIGSIVFADANNIPIAGRVFLTNQYQPNPNLSGNIQLNNTAKAAIQNTGLTGGGNVDIDSRGSITIDGPINVSAGFDRNTKSFGGNAGDVRLIAKDNIIFTPNSAIFSGGLLGGNITLKTDADIQLIGTDFAPIITSVSFSDVPGMAGGNINVNAKSLFLSNGALLDTRTSGAANAGDVTIITTSGIELTGEDSAGSTSGISSRVDVGGTGNSGNLRVESPRLVLRDGTFIATAVFGDGIAGDLNVKARDIELVGTSANASVVSGLAAFVEPGGTGKAGNINIETERLTVRDGGVVTAENRGIGEGGNLTVKAREVNVIGISTVNPDLASALAVAVTQAPTDKSGGNLIIETERLSVLNGAQISVDVEKSGNGGNLQVSAQEIEVIGYALAGPSSLSALLVQEATGKSGNVSIETQRLTIAEGGQVRVDTFGNGDAGNLAIKAQQVEVIGTTINSQFPSSIGALVLGGTGKGGNITIETDRLLARDGGQIGAATFGNGDGGTLTINAREIELIGVAPNEKFTSGLASSVQPTATGNGGNVTVVTSNLSVRDGAAVTVSTQGKGNGGELTINAQKVEITGKSAIGERATSLQAVSGGLGEAGAIKIDTQQLMVGDGARVSVEARGAAKAGDLEVRASDITLDGGAIGAETESGSQGNINLAIDNSLNLQNNSRISAATINGQGGTLTVNAQNAIVLDNASQISSSATGDGGIGGNIEMSGGRLQARDRSTIQATTQSGNGGNITLNIADLLILRNNSNISSTAGQAGAGGDGGNITINSPFIVTFPTENSDITAQAYEGKGGNINLTVQSIFGLQVADEISDITNDISASSRLGIDGTVDINTPDIDPSQGLIELLSNLTDPANQIVAGCPAEGGNRFVVTGRGGLPEDPRQALRGQVVMQDLRNRTESNIGRIRDRENFAIANPKQPIIEAQGWILNPQGKVELVDNISQSNGMIENRAIDCSTIKKMTQ